MFTRSAFRAIGFLAGCLAFFFLLTPTATAASHVAYVYVGTANGVYLYDAASDGSLTLVSGSPYPIAGSAIGSNGGYFISLGTNYLHSYPVASNGAIQNQVSQINTADYFSNPAQDCGATAGGELDHTGHNIYVLRGLNGCSALQSYQISNSGFLTFLDSSSFDNGVVSPYVVPPAITANGVYGYNGVYDGSCDEGTNMFQRQSSGAMQYGGGFAQNYPIPDPGWGGFEGVPVIAAGPFDAIAMGLQEYSPDGCGGPVKPVQLASYTVDSQGGLHTTNTSQNMPFPDVYPTVMNISPSGEFLAVGGDPQPQIQGDAGYQTAGLQVFHFNGADPITVESGKLTTVPIDEIHWDSSNHLYALSNSTGWLFVYTVTASSVTPVPGSPYKIASPNALTVVPTIPSCTSPSTAGVHICSPTGTSTVLSPLQVQASATVTGTINNTQLWVDGAKKYTSDSKSLNTSISLDPGAHRIAVLALNSAGQIWESAVNATVAGCAAPASPGVHICYPANSSTVGNPVQVLARATVTGTIASTQIWVDGVKTYTVASASLDTDITLYPGTHRVAVLATNQSGERWESAVYVTVSSN
jgi:hypothetical protein